MYLPKFCNLFLFVTVSSSQAKYAKMITERKWDLNYIMYMYFQRKSCAISLHLYLKELWCTCNLPPDMESNIVASSITRHLKMNPPKLWIVIKITCFQSYGWAVNHNGHIQWLQKKQSQGNTLSSSSSLLYTPRRSIGHPPVLNKYTIKLNYICLWTRSIITL